YKTTNVTLERDLPVLREVVNGTWKKEDELKALKSDLSALERKIQLSIMPQIAEQDTGVEAFTNELPHYSILIPNDSVLNQATNERLNNTEVSVIKPAGTLQIKDMSERTKIRI
ncbi:MAG: hypothetical protein RR444_09185, partial [Oscillospiraceae bacterium]